MDLQFGHGGDAVDDEPDPDFSGVETCFLQFGHGGDAVDDVTKVRSKGGEFVPSIRPRR